jgi:hypothetical protein
MSRIGSSKIRCTVSVAFVVLVLGLLAACQTPGPIKSSGMEKANVPDEARLRARLAEFHGALVANDIARWYAMTAPVVRDKMTFEQFKKDVRWDENAGRRKETRMTASLGRACSCTPMNTTRCVLIVDVMIEDADGKIKKERPLEMWEYAGGEWYWGYMGAESRGRCPGER